MKQIVCLSSSPWYPFPTRKQNVMKRLPDCEVLYFDPPVTYIAPLKDKNAKEKLRAYRQEQKKPQENIRVFALPPVLPFYNRFRFINKLNQRRQARFVRSKMKRCGFEKPLLWCYLPSQCDIVDKIPHSGTVYDCVDRHSAYGGTMSPQVVDEMEKELALKCDCVFATAAGLFDTLKSYGGNVSMIPNGVDYALFSKADLPQPCPPELSELPRPIFGFVGMLQECLDYDCAIELAKHMPDASVVFVGREQPGVDLSALKALKNVYFTGPKPHDKLPEYIAQFDVCLNIFREGALSRDVSPLKFYEYLATGKPIVSTAEPLQVQEYADAIYIADSPVEFAERCAEAALDTNAEMKKRRMAHGLEASWDARVELICKKLRRAGIGW